MTESDAQVLPVEGADQRGGGQEQGSVRQHVELLLDAAQQVLGDLGLTYGAGGQIQELVAVVVDVGKQLGYTRLGPVPANDGQDLSQDIRPKQSRSQVNISGNLLSIVSISKGTAYSQGETAYLVIVPSMSETTILSS